MILSPSSCCSLKCFSQHIQSKSLQHRCSSRPVLTEPQHVFVSNRNCSGESFRLALALNWFLHVFSEHLFAMLMSKYSGERDVFRPGCGSKLLIGWTHLWKEEKKHFRDQRKIFHLIEISAFPATFFDILDVSKCTFSPNQYVLFVLPCSQSVYPHLAKYGFSCSVSIWLEPNTDWERLNTYKCSANTNKCSASVNWEWIIACGAHQYVFVFS